MADDPILDYRRRRSSNISNREVYETYIFKFPMFTIDNILDFEELYKMYKSEGSLELNDISKLLKHLNFKYTSQEVIKVFNEIDVNKNGKIEFLEFLMERLVYLLFPLNPHPLTL
ncbi:hypothetical protein A3Q56_05830 [Intoshia linei]|uniref:EF-hand domain-containing protein n=1 Tax=Intoshia linei TaxID=1819745 RepID=A0A177AX19_9BILA|nr:hypothetical protein A3Q56_05830 [Intoshia linei]